MWTVYEHTTYHEYAMVRHRKVPNLAKNCSWQKKRGMLATTEVIMPLKTEMPRSLTLLQDNERVSKYDRKKGAAPIVDSPKGLSDSAVCISRSYFVRMSQVNHIIDAESSNDTNQSTLDAPQTPA